ncbi:dihydrolipoamide acetyltransferase family protein [Candidatus Deferrimicrobium sp.]|uniref:dihydrolipoamide acetyltransferase family protein n=1 Tax=Candidatus Deferrimicrobium sp. TaxID=3060586 RepID=UPI0027164F42|nr:dihydrolipoamide acetyltransferase family protein [Candidatus Deferrimicrobium sp.]MDO8738553.1 dihydrolipoamide acetyltransferase family protein [Candidatus Deferrimicrobium sp.]
MAIELKLPDVGEGIAEGEVVRWLVAEGAQVKEDDPLVEILTDKANVEIPSPVTGTVVKILAAPGQVVKVGELLALIEPAAGKAPGASGEVLATPVVRKLAKDLGVELGAVPGSGPGGRITEEDVRRAAGPKVPAGAPAESTSEERIPFRGRRRMIARKMVAAKTRVPHALLVDEADVSGLLAERAKMREIGEREGVRITILPFIMKAVAGALQRHPALNASLDEGREEIVLKKKVDIGMAVDAEDGLVVPVVRNADAKSVIELAREIERLSAAAREGTLAPGDLTGGTFTISSVGSIGGLFSYPVINVPEAAILAAHKIVNRPVVRDGEIVPRDMMYLSLSFDHRIVDGGEATRFLNEVVRRIEASAI